MFHDRICVIRLARPSRKICRKRGERRTRPDSICLPLRRQPILRRLAARPRPEKRKELTCAALPPSLPGPRFILSLPSGTGKTTLFFAPSPGNSHCLAVSLPAPLLRW